MPYIGKLAVPQGQPALLPVEDLTADDFKAARIKRIGERANRLRREKYLEPEEVWQLSKWANEGTYALVDIEAMLYLSERHFMEHFTERPCNRLPKKFLMPSKQRTG